jgi:hypothetical protein
MMSFHAIGTCALDTKETGFLSGEGWRSTIDFGEKPGFCVSRQAGEIGFLALGYFLLFLLVQIVVNSFSDFFVFVEVHSVGSRYARFSTN